MIFKKLKDEMLFALKAGNKKRREVIAQMVNAIQKESITSKGRIPITDDLANQALMKYQKMVQETIDTCPKNREDIRADALAEMSIVKEFAPQLIIDKRLIKQTISQLISQNDISLLKINKGKIMKTIIPFVKGKMDMKIVNEILGEMLA